MECLIHSPAFNNVEMAWVAGVGLAHERELDQTELRVRLHRRVRQSLEPARPGEQFLRSVLGVQGASAGVLRCLAHFGVLYGIISYSVYSV